MKIFKPKKIVVGMIGMGNISNIHLEAYKLRKDVQIKAIADTDQGMLLRKAAQLHIKDVYPDYHFMLQDPDINVIDVMTPHFLHKQCVCDALEAGKTVICEKPLAICKKDVDLIVKTSRVAKKYVYVKEYFRYSLSNQRVVEMLQNQYIGQPYYIQCMFTGDSRHEYLNPLTWRGDKIQSGGGVFMDVGVHVLDWLQLVFGSPCAVYAQHRQVTASLINKGEDFATTLLEFHDGLIINISTTHNDIGYKFRWEIRIYGTKGALTIIDTGKQSKVLQVIRDNKVIYTYSEPYWWMQSNIRAIHDILDHIQSNSPPPVSYEHVTSVMQTVFAIYTSASKNRRIRL